MQDWHPIEKLYRLEPEKAALLFDMMPAVIVGGREDERTVVSLVRWDANRKIWTALSGFSLTFKPTHFAVLSELP